MTEVVNIVYNQSSTETCHLCGQPTLSTESEIHIICADEQNFGFQLDPALATETCHLCGKPSFPFEERIHSECAMYENFLASQ